MKKFLLIIFLLPIICSSQNQSETEMFMNNLFFDLPVDASKIQIVNEINKNSSLEKANVAYLGTFSNIIKNSYLDITKGSAELLVLYNDSNTKVDVYKILLKNQTNQNNAQTIVNLLRSTDVKIEFGKNDRTKADQYSFWNNNNKYAFCIIEIELREKWMTLSGKQEYFITISYYVKNI